MKENIVISMGGSLIFGEKIDTSFHKNIKKVLSKHINNYNIAIVCGGGKTARDYTYLAKELSLSSEVQDILGIEATRLNAKLMIYVLGEITTGKVYKTIEELISDFGEKITICGGIKPGQRTDKVAALIAEKLGAKNLINLTNVDGVFDKDPRKFSNAKLIKELDYSEFCKLSGIKEHKPSYHFVFDFDAAEICHKKNIRVIIINGNKLENLDAYLSKEQFLGSIINF
ncbi:MAG: UMP kinase [Candidatus Helarchaeota archaeon]